MKEFIKKFIPSFLISFYHFILALLGAFFYSFPSRQIKVIGVTGTNGKTTVTEMIYEILKKAGQNPALINSIRFKVGDLREVNMLKMTMPGRFKLQRFLRKAVKNGCSCVILEVTSEGIKQHRHKFIKFEAAVFTNLSPEHIEAHGGFEKYKQAKGRLFGACKNIHIINKDDPSADYFLKFRAQNKVLYGESDKDLVGKINLLGKFNIYNALAAIKTGLCFGVDLKTCQAAIKEVKEIPGRMQEIASAPFRVIVDYAFTPNALEKVYQDLQPANLICVLGAAGGGRDKWKRPILGKIAAKYCKEIIVTNEDPYDEDPLEIINEVAEGAGKNAKKIVDRRKAIREAFQLAESNDTVVITCKGTEPWICLARGKKIPWDDRKVAREELAKLKQ